MRSSRWLLLLILLVGCGAPPPIEPPPHPTSRGRATIVLAHDEGTLRLRRLRVAIPGPLSTDELKLVDGFTLWLEDETTRRIALVDLRRIEVVGRVLNRLEIKVVAKEALRGTVGANLLVRGEGKLGLPVKVRLEETRSITVQR